jgi:hypothetical protein
MKVKIYSLIGIVVIGLTIFLTTITSSQGITKHYGVKLYSGDKVIASWDARELGRVDGESLTFSVGSDLNPRYVRISGTYSVEEFQ